MAEGNGVEESPQIVLELVASLVRFVAQAYHLAEKGLDLTPETLSFLDQYVRDARADVREKPETLVLLEGAVGAYLGEVIRRAHGGYWEAEGEPDTWRVLLKPVFLSFNPVGMAREALTLEEQPGWHAHLETDPAETEMLERRLAALPDADEEEYYAPTTRFDVVHIAVDALAAQQRAQGLGDVTFTKADYR